MLFKPGTPIYAFEIEREGEQDVMYINYLGAPFVPSISDSGEAMSRVIDYLIKTPNVSRVVFVQQRNYSYDFSQALMLSEIANLYTYLTKQEKLLSPSKLSFNNPNELPRRYESISYLLMTLKSDPITCYRDLKTYIFSEKLALEKTAKKEDYDRLVYIRALENFLSLLENLKIIKLIEKDLDSYARGDRTIYASVFRADIIPNFTFTRLVSQLPRDAEIVDQYEIGEGYDISTVTILKRPDDLKYLYHLMPP
ncbi:MAG: hypothetical protein AABY22_16195, partial [Nanoarchaeota archaeon]